jgi:hypothetical protein
VRRRQGFGGQALLHQVTQVSAGKNCVKRKGKKQKAYSLLENKRIHFIKPASAASLKERFT